MIPHGAIFWQVCLILRWKEPYETAGLVWQCFSPAISHLLWDVFSTMRERRAAWNRDSWKININFRSQILFCLLQIKPPLRRESSSFQLLFVRVNLCSCVWERTQRQWVDDLIVHLQVLKAKMSVPLCICMCVLQWPLCPLMFFLMWFVTGQREIRDKILPHLPWCVKFTTSHLCIFFNQHNQQNSGDMISTLGENVSQHLQTHSSLSKLGTVTERLEPT